MKKLSIIIVTYNSLEDILNCIDAIYDKSDMGEEFLEIIVVDNSSAEVFKTMEKMIENKYGYTIQIIHNYENKGYGQGNNVGIKNALSDIVCVINPDVLLQNSCFSRILDCFKKDTKLAVIGGKQLGGINLSFWIRPEFELFIITTPLCLLLNKLNLYFQRFFFLSGALLFIDKNKFEDIGGFDEEIFLYCEEADVTKRFLQFGFRTKFDKSIVYRHLIDERGEVGESTFNLQMKSLQYYLQKYDYSFSKFINKRLLSYKFLMLFSKIIKNKNLEKKSFKNISFLNKIKRSIYRKI